jgi:hypothetical protein
MTESDYVALTDSDANEEKKTKTRDGWRFCVPAGFVAVGLLLILYIAFSKPSSVAGMESRVTRPGQSTTQPAKLAHGSK